MTDREKIINAIEKALAVAKAVDGEFIYITRGEAERALELLKEQEPQAVNDGGWISVKTKLPGKLQNVLVSLVNEIDGHRLKAPQIGYHTDDAGHSWFIASWNEWAIDSDFMVTHWTPMPEGPKEEEM